jgi:flagellar hook-length control protein FliK
MVDCNIAGLGHTQGAPSSTPGGASAGSAEELAALFAGILAGLEGASTADGRTGVSSASPGEPGEDTGTDSAAEDPAEERSAGFAPCIPPPWSLPLPERVTVAAVDSVPPSASTGTFPEAIPPAGGGAGESNGAAAAQSPGAVTAPPAPDAPAAGDLPDGVQAAGAPEPSPAVEDPHRASRDQAARALARALADVGLSRQVPESDAAQNRETGRAEAPARVVQPAVPTLVARDPGSTPAVDAGHARTPRMPGNQNDTAAPAAAAVQIAAARGSAPAFPEGATEHGSSSDGHSRRSSGEAPLASAQGDRIGSGQTPAPAFAVDHQPRLDRAEPRAAGPSHVPADRLTHAEASGVAQQLVQSIRVQAREGVNEAHVRLRPEHLGEVRISIKAEGDRIAAILHIERADVRHAVESQGQELRTHLASHGLQLDELTVRDDGESRHGRQARPDQDAPNRRHRRGAPDREFELEPEP